MLISQFKGLSRPDKRENFNLKSNKEVILKMLIGPNTYQHSKATTHKARTTKTKNQYYALI